MKDLNVNDKKVNIVEAQGLLTYNLIQTLNSVNPSFRDYDPSIERIMLELNMERTKQMNLKYRAK